VDFSYLNVLLLRVIASKTFSQFFNLAAKQKDPGKLSEGHDDLQLLQKQSVPKKMNTAGSEQPGTDRP
jgi:hypothetical protein